MTEGQVVFSLMLAGAVFGLAKAQDIRSTGRATIGEYASYAFFWCIAFPLLVLSGYGGLLAIKWTFLALG
ncbi:hypothetical protein [Alcanivorax sp. DP30]|uniref:hypothetical protein n=1 Tax=Alcanivorax sp. DP30 TaxID=2606217 RepID=UPI00136EB1E1|nr:hypothetical protein [Alcanivorax sp. DP30]MZR63814.1 hypothetical protein [Alcanivorax sp. DP30]